MKWAKVSVYVFCGLFFGCTTIDRNLVNNHFSSTYPKLDIVIDPGLEYIGNFKKDALVKAVDGRSKLKTSWDYYTFARTEGHKLEKAFILGFIKIETHFISDLFRNTKNQLDSGMCKLGGKNYQYCTTLFYNLARNEIKDYLFEKGYVIPCGLVRSYARPHGTDRNRCILILYFESIEKTDLACNSWADKKWFTDRHINYLKGFHQRAESTFRFIDDRQESRETISDNVYCTNSILAMSSPPS